MKQKLKWPNRVILLSFCVILLFVSCAGNKKSTNQDAVILKPEICKDYLFTHFVVDKITPIETNDDFLLTRIDKVIRTSEGVLVFSKSDGIVALIDEDSGKLISKIRRIGTGPGEYKKIVDIAYNEEEKQIFIFNDYQKLQSFDLQENFLSEIEEDELYEAITYNDGQVLFHSPGEGYASYPYVVAMYHLNEKSWKKYAKDIALEFPIRSKGDEMVGSKRVWISANLDNVLYTFEGNELIPQYRIDTPMLQRDDETAKLVASNLMEGHKEIGQKRLLYSLNSIRETDKHVIFRSNLYELYFLDKQSGKLYKEKPMVQQWFCLSANDYIPHVGNDNSLMFLLTAKKWLYEVSMNNLVPEVRKTANSIQISEDSNPILFLLKEK